MAFEIACPACGETEQLRGERRERLIALVCERCAAEWVREPGAVPMCETGGDEMRQAVQAVVEKSRGTQLSIQSFRQVWLCPTCDGARWTSIARWPPTAAQCTEAGLAIPAVGRQYGV